MACSDSFCIPMMEMSMLLTPPEFPPPPPIPSFMAGLVEKDNLTDSCDLCSKWVDQSLLGGSEDNFSFVLALVAIISALSGAGIMAAILSIRRFRQRRSHPDSMRHLERKCNEHQTLPLPPSRSTNSTPLSNTYCEGPYNDNKEYHCSNIYAELHSHQNCAGVPNAADLWRRPPIPTPAVDNCYLELRDLPGVSLPLGAATPLFHNSLQSPTYSLSPSTTTASYYTDLELRRECSN